MQNLNFALPCGLHIMKLNLARARVWHLRCKSSRQTLNTWSRDHDPCSLFQRRSCGNWRRRTTPSRCDRSWRRSAAGAASWSRRSTTSCEPGGLPSNDPSPLHSFSPARVCLTPPTPVAPPPPDLTAWKTRPPRAPKSHLLSLLSLLRHLQPAAVKVRIPVDAASTRTSWMWPVHRVLSSTQTNRRTRWPTPSSSSSTTTSAFTSRTSASSRRSRRWRRTSRSAAKGEEGEICQALTLHLVFYVNVNLKKRLCFVIHRLTENMRRLSECFRLSGCSEFVLILRQYLYWLENSLWIINQKMVAIFFSVKYWNIELYSLCLFFSLFPRARIPTCDQLHEKPFCLIQLVLWLHVSHRIYRESAVHSSWSEQPISRWELFIYIYSPS